MKKSGEVGSLLISTLENECISHKEKQGSPVIFQRSIHRVVMGTFTLDQKSDLSRNHAILTDGHEVNQSRDNVQALNLFAEGMILNWEHW